MNVRSQRPIPSTICTKAMLESRTCQGIFAVSSNRCSAGASVTLITAVYNVNYMTVRRVAGESRRHIRARVKGKVAATKRRPDHERRGKLKVMVSNGKRILGLRLKATSVCAKNHRRWDDPSSDRLH